jgi:Na+/H+ antiporter NhaD/arsenite permease-like protein
VPEVSFLGTVFHFLGEIEAVFGMWVLVLACAAIYFHSWIDFGLYLSYDREFVEPMFVVIIMAIAASRPVLRFAEGMMSLAAKLGKGSPSAWWLSVLIIAPVLGSFITEPAAMTLLALVLKRRYFDRGISTKLAYITLGLLFVNVSIGGTLTNFAAPPVLMVAGKWKWDTAHMLATFGWKAAAACAVSTTVAMLLFRREIAAVVFEKDESTAVPRWLTAVHVMFLASIVFFAHHPDVFFGIFVLFLGVVTATKEYQDELALREGLLVGFFLAGLVTLGSMQAYWLKPLIGSLDGTALFFGATGLTALTDNAALTYLGSLVEGISDELKYALVAGAVTGGGLTVIANAPNPAGIGILQSAKVFKDEGISPLGLFLGALMPTAVAVVFFWFLR